AAITSQPNSAASTRPRSLMSTASTLVPSRLRRRATARPIPRAAPVTTARRSPADALTAAPRRQGRDVSPGDAQQQASDPSLALGRWAGLYGNVIENRKTRCWRRRKARVFAVFGGILATGPAGIGLDHDAAPAL